MWLILVAQENYQYRCVRYADFGRRVSMLAQFLPSPPPHGRRFIVPANSRNPAGQKGASTRGRAHPLPTRGVAE